MKKIILSLLFVAAGLTAFAAPSARVTIKNGSASVTLREDAAEESFKAFGTPAIVLTIGTTNYSEITSANIEGVALQYIPTAESFNLTISNVIGELYLVDANDNSRILLVDGATIPVTATAAEVAAGNYISGRFTLSKVAPVVPEFCFKYEKLTVNAYAGKTLKISKDGTDVVAEFTLGDTYEYDFSAAAAGRYVVTFDGTEYQIDVKPSVTEKP